jgi:transcriptional regulator with XRE-family HTH domain
VAVLRRFGRRVRELRAEKGFSQEDLAARAELDWKHLQGNPSTNDVLKSSRQRRAA